MRCKPRGKKVNVIISRGFFLASFANLGFHFLIFKKFPYKLNVVHEVNIFVYIVTNVSNKKKMWHLIF